VRLQIIYFSLPFVAAVAKAQAAQSLGEGAMRQFNVGQVVTYIPDLFLRHAASGDYRVVAAMPDRDGDHMYRIKSPLEEHERVVKESFLVKSDGCLPEEIPKQSSRRGSITLPTLAATAYFPACAGLDDPADTDPSASTS